MECLRGRQAAALVEFFGEDYRRIEHALCVLHEVDNLLTQNPAADSDIVVASALLHDVGIKPSEAAFGKVPENGRIVVLEKEICDLRGQLGDQGGQLGVVGDYLPG